jgi:nicotinamide riboside kinase
MQIKIAITGPESSGKTTLSESLNHHYYNSMLIPEFSREYLNKLNRKYNYSDLLKIAKGQKKNELISCKKNTRIVISDTCLQVIKIWSQEKFKKCDPWILNKQENYTHYLLCKPDFPWEFDVLRENPIDRDHLFNIYLNDLKNKPYTIISGNKNERLSMGKKIINHYLNIEKNK